MTLLYYISSLSFLCIWAASCQNQWHVRPAKTQISLGIHPVWSESSLSAWRKVGSLATHWAHSKDTDQNGWMPRLIWVFAGRTVILLVLSWSGSFLFSRIQMLLWSRVPDWWARIKGLVTCLFLFTLCSDKSLKCSKFEIMASQTHSPLDRIPPHQPSVTIRGANSLHHFIFFLYLLYLSRLMTKPTKWPVRPTKTQIILGILPVWSESSLCTQWVAKDPSFLRADREDCRMPRLIRVFAGRTAILLVWSWGG